MMKAPRGELTAPKRVDDPTLPPAWVVIGFLVYAIAHACLLYRYTPSFMSQTTTNPTATNSFNLCLFICLAQCLLLVYDNALLFFSHFLSGLTPGLHKARYFIHGTVTPTLLIAVSNLLCLYKVNMPDVVYYMVVLASFFFSFNGLRHFFSLKLEPVRDPRTNNIIRWKRVDGLMVGDEKFVELLPVVLAVLVPLILGYYRQKLMFAASAIMLVCASDPKNLLLGNFGEVIYMAGLLYGLTNAPL